MKKYAVEKRPRARSSKERAGYEETGIGLKSGLDFAACNHKKSLFLAVEVCTLAPHAAVNSNEPDRRITYHGCQ